MTSNQEEINWWKDTRILDGTPNKYDITRRTDFRGLPAEKIRETFDKEVSKQVEDMQKERDQLLEEAAKAARLARESERLAKAVDYDSWNKNKLVVKGIAGANKLASDQHISYEKHLNRTVYGENQPDDYFWRYFGASGR